MADAVRFALSNFTLTFLVVGIVAAMIDLVRRRQSSEHRVPEALLAWFLLFSIGMAYFYNFVMHVFFGDMAAAFIGWENSPFQAEVGYASLGFSLAFLWGAAIGHVQQMITAHDFAPGNAGITFWMDIFVPLIGFALLWLRYRHREVVLAPAIEHGLKAKPKR
jgi:hypothetical protein